VDAVRWSHQPPSGASDSNSVRRYQIGQRFARDFSTKDRIFICGDAAHTHSSGAAQGLNTGIHDAVNLGWKLALQIRGVTQPSVLRTYSPERRSAVQKLIDYDKDISTLMSYKWPAWYEGDKNADPYIVLGQIFEKAASFNTGLGISYGTNVLNQPSLVELAVVPGSRPPDVALTMPGTNQPTRFQRVTRNIGKFHVVVFTGNSKATLPSLLELETFLTSAKEVKTHEAVDWVTISPTVGCSPYEAIGMRPFGNCYFDAANAAHEKFGVDLDKGSVLVLRPDGLVGTAGPVEGSWIKQYLSTVLRFKSLEKGHTNGFTNGH
jgi:phenol 2-monooxygenase (NADPH)